MRCDNAYGGSSNRRFPCHWTDGLSMPSDKTYFVQSLTLDQAKSPYVSMLDLDNLTRELDRLMSCFSGLMEFIVRESVVYAPDLEPARLGFDSEAARSLGTTRAHRSVSVISSLSKGGLGITAAGSNAEHPCRTLGDRPLHYPWLADEV
jgi:hypothetical protein